MKDPVSLQDVQLYQNSQKIRDKIKQTLPTIGAALIIITLAGLSLVGAGVGMSSPIGVIGICLASVGGLGVASAVAAGVILHILNKKGGAALAPKNIHNAIKDADFKEGGKILDKLDNNEFWQFMKYASEQDEIPDSIMNAINTQSASNRLLYSLLGCKPSFVRNLISQNKQLAGQVTMALEDAVKDFQFWDKSGSMNSTKFTQEFVKMFSPVDERLALSYYPETDKKDYQNQYRKVVSDLMGALKDIPDCKDLIRHMTTFAQNQSC